MGILKLALKYLTILNLELVGLAFSCFWGTVF